MRKNKQAEDYYIFGIHASLAAMANSKRKIKTVFCNKDILNSHQNIIKTHNYEILSDQELARLTNKEEVHQGIILLVETIEENILANFSDNSRVVLLDQVNDVQNVGAILRSAQAFNIEAVIMTHDNSPPENGTMAKIASGGLENVRLIRVVNLKSAINDLKKMGFWVYGLDGQSDNLLMNINKEGKVALVMGAEGKGIRHLTRQHCDLIYKIPMQPQSESMNVANAATIAFWELYK